MEEGASNVANGQWRKASSGNMMANFLENMIL